MVAVDQQAQPGRVVADDIVEEEEKVLESAHVGLVEQPHDVGGQCLAGCTHGEVVQIAHDVASVVLLLTVAKLLAEIFAEMRLQLRFVDGFDAGLALREFGHPLELFGRQRLRVAVGEFVLVLLEVHGVVAGFQVLEQLDALGCEEGIQVFFADLLAVALQSLRRLHPAFNL